MVGVEFPPDLVLVGQEHSGSVCLTNDEADLVPARNELITDLVLLRLDRRHALSPHQSTDAVRHNEWLGSAVLENRLAFDEPRDRECDDRDCLGPED